jgi:hypothetical protein
MITCDARALVVALLAAVMLRAPPAAAQAEDQPAARALFNEARTLVKAGQYSQACPKLEAAAKLYRGSGVLLNLADCYEHIGRTASAWNEFGEAASLARRSGRDDDEAEARKRQAALEPQLAHVLARVKDAAPGLSLTWDDKELPSAAWETPIPVDPGPHTLAASAPGRTPWSTSTEVTSGVTVTVDVPVLESVPTTVQPEPVVRVSPPPPHYWTQRRKVGIAVGTSGLVTFGVGGVLALVADTNFNHAKAETGSARTGDSANAVTLGNVATVVGGIGIAATALGAIVWLTAPSNPVRVGVSPSGVGGKF